MRSSDHDPRPAPEPAEQLPDRIGPYRILSVLGEGGMGTVYLAAQDEPIRREVALKVIKLGMDTRAVLRRFDAERQALARMEHGNIANVLDAGIGADGRPWFAMEYVRGAPVTEHCEQHDLDLAARIDLFVRICSGVQHAHHKGIIHRDLKPANVLVAEVEGRAVPKIIDFGLARATDHRALTASLYTEQGQIIGTPAYMSPEQADLANHDIDTRTDVYSLGILLFELLTGTLPFDAEELKSGGIVAMQRLICEVDPPRPSTRVQQAVDAADGDGARGPHHRWLKALRGDLDWIVLRALEKDPGRRYQTPLELAEDLQRNLRSEPVSARPPTLTYRLSKFVRKNRVGVTAAAAVLLALVAGAVASTLLLIETQAARRRAEAAVDVSQRQLALAEMAALDQAAWWTSRSLEAARAPTLEEVVAHQVDGRPVLRPQARQAIDPWGSGYRIEPGAVAGDWVVQSDGPDRTRGSDDDLQVHDALFRTDLERRLRALFDQRASRLLDLAQELLVLNQTNSQNTLLELEAMVDPWNHRLVFADDSGQGRLVVRSAGPDGVLGSADDLEQTREMMPTTVAPADVKAQIGKSRRVFCILELAFVHPSEVVGWLRSLLAEEQSPAQGLIFGALRDDAIALLGPPDKVAFALDSARQLELLARGR